MSYHHHPRASSLLPTESHHSSGFTPSMQRLMDKQREYEAFYKIHQQSQQLLDFLSQFSDQYMVLDGGSEGQSRVQRWRSLTHCWLGVPRDHATRRVGKGAARPDFGVLTVVLFPAVGDVVEHWQTAFRATHLALASLEQQRKEAEASETSTHNLLPERLVRIPVATPNEVDDPAAASYDPAESSS
ncbi:BQ5605_C029g10700 [Microbotryum silenes-dioicae]|uniref:DASH complex subunit DAD2 n=1 Tax=Microbotryum silenes-dioicae TaxID=796604 RepID=A0A2X0MMN2_9BASI|nr:BQ5605_C029g10700 [Microbotryum silenes-dioicae]